MIISDIYGTRAVCDTCEKELQQFSPGFAPDESRHYCSKQCQPACDACGCTCPPDELVPAPDLTPEHGPAWHRCRRCHAEHRDTMPAPPPTLRTGEAP